MKIKKTIDVLFFNMSFQFASNRFCLFSRNEKILGFRVSIKDNHFIFPDDIPALRILCSPGIRGNKKHGR
jgi:hypothetical protein